MTRHDRAHPTHGILQVDGQPTIIFDTVCTRRRDPWLANAEVHDLLRRVWQQATGWLVGRYVIMPDHVHYFAAATSQSADYEAWVRYWKAQFSLAFNRRDCRWQVDHWDTRVRTAEGLEGKWTYILKNPVRRGLVTCASDWPYQGEIHELRWD
jgi:putative transposase